jgi:hypothetical protein
VGKGPEGKLQLRVMADLKRLKASGAPIWFAKINSMYSGGIPDILICYSGRFMAVELKAPSGKTTKLQEQSLNQVERAGGVAWVVYSWEQWLAFKGEYILGAANA